MSNREMLQEVIDLCAIGDVDESTEAYGWGSLIGRIKATIASDAKRYADSEKLQAIGKSAYDSIVEMVAALECDYDRLGELREIRGHGVGALMGKLDNPTMEWISANPDEADELAELEEAVGECESREDAETRIQEDPLSVQVRTGWFSPTDVHDDRVPTPEEFEILLSTGGPATRIIGELENGEPTRARIQAQDWFQPWTDYIGGDQETLLTYCRCFYFGEG